MPHNDGTEVVHQNKTHQKQTSFETLKYDLLFQK